MTFLKDRQKTPILTAGKKPEYVISTKKTESEGYEKSSNIVKDHNKKCKGHQKITLQIKSDDHRKM